MFVGGLEPLLGPMLAVLGGLRRLLGPMLAAASHSQVPRPRIKSLKGAKTEDYRAFFYRYMYFVDFEFMLPYPTDNNLPRWIFFACSLTEVSSKGSHFGSKREVHRNTHKP